MTKTPDILHRILREKARELTRKAELEDIRVLAARAEQQAPARGLAKALSARIDAGRPAVIAEMKRMSPSKGLLREPYSPPAIARSYRQAGAAALSVLTDKKYFGGDLRDLTAARASASLPALRKDFIIDQYQIYEARAIGADGILLIVAALDDAQLVEYSGLALHLGMDCLVEVHTDGDLDRALRLNTPLVGINNRDLHTFETTLETTYRLREKVPDDRTLVTESGVATPEDVAALRARGVHGFLVGETFMRAIDPGERLRQLFGVES